MGPIQTPMQAPIQFQSRSHITTTDLIELDAKKEPKLSKAQKRKLRMQKRKNGVVQQQTPSICSSAGPTKPPMPNNKSKAKASKPAGKSEPKLSKAQKRKMRKNKMKNAA